MTVDYGGVCTTTKSVILALPPSVGGGMAAAMLHLPRPLFEDAAAAAAVEMKQLQPAFEVDVASVKHSQ